MQVPIREAAAAADGVSVSLQNSVVITPSVGLINTPGSSLMSA